jgi:hypothetical protein
MCMLFFIRYILNLIFRIYSIYAQYHILRCKLTMHLKLCAILYMTFVYYMSCCVYESVIVPVVNIAPAVKHMREFMVHLVLLT